MQSNLMVKAGGFVDSLISKVHQLNRKLSYRMENREKRIQLFFNTTDRAKLFFRKEDLLKIPREDWVKVEAAVRAADDLQEKYRQYLFSSWSEKVSFQWLQKKYQEFQMLPYWQLVKRMSYLYPLSVFEMMDRFQGEPDIFGLASLLHFELEPSDLDGLTAGELVLFLEALKLRSKYEAEWSLRYHALSLAGHPEARLELIAWLGVGGRYEDSHPDRMIELSQHAFGKKVLSLERTKEK